MHVGLARRLEGDSFQGRLHCEDLPVNGLVVALAVREARLPHARLALQVVELPPAEAAIVPGHQDRILLALARDHLLQKHRLPVLGPQLGGRKALEGGVPGKEPLRNLLRVNESRDLADADEGALQLLHFRLRAHAVDVMHRALVGHPLPQVLLDLEQPLVLPRLDLLLPPPHSALPLLENVRLRLHPLVLQEKIVLLLRALVLALDAELRERALRLLLLVACTQQR
mmetsp:Transcript_2179/g.7762  ORF Transcript_2179/g.7762 Transcript_2179/m.7762 type:complete len:227 (-) Transcript_2179:970-1650(-)